MGGVREGLTHEVTHEQRPEGGEEGNVQVKGEAAFQTARPVDAVSYRQNRVRNGREASEPGAV